MRYIEREREREGGDMREVERESGAAGERRKNEETVKKGERSTR